MNCVKEFLVCNLFFREKITKALFLERFCIQNLVASAGSCWQRNQNIRFAECENFTYGIGTCTGYNEICSSKKIAKFFFDEFILHITGHIVERFVSFAFAA